MAIRTRRSGFTMIELLVMLAIIGILVALLLPAVQSAREAARRVQCSNNMKQFAIAMHNYHDAYNCLPASTNEGKLAATSPLPGSAGEPGSRAGFSWRVSILPYVEQMAMYDMIDFKQSAYADVPEHRRAAGVVMSLHRCPSDVGKEFATAPEYGDPQSLSNYVAMGATHAASLYREETEPAGGRAHPNGLIFPGAYTRFRDVIDGTSNTLMLSETKERRYAAWLDGTTAAVVGLAEETKPAFHKGDGRLTGDVPNSGVRSTLNYGNDSPPEFTYYLPKSRHSGKENWLHGPSSHHPGVVNHAMCDGSVRGISVSLEPRVYMHLITRAGGEVVNRDF